MIVSHEQKCTGGRGRRAGGGWTMEITVVKFSGDDNFLNGSHMF